MPLRILFLAALVTLLGRQDPPQPTFKSGVNFVEVDVVVTDRTGFSRAGTFRAVRTGGRGTPARTTGHPRRPLQTCRSPLRSRFALVPGRQSRPWLSEPP